MNPERPSDPLRYPRFFVATLGVGIAGAGFAILFRLLLHHGLALVAGSSDVLAAFEALPFWRRLLLPAAGGLVAGLITTILARRAGGHGVAEVLEAVALGRGEISLPGVLAKSVASLAAILGGGSIGREGPIIQFGAGSGSIFGRWLGLDARDQRMLVAAGTAAGFAAAYNTPIAAVIFVLEVVTGVVNLDALLPIVMATTLATILTRVAVGGGPLYGARLFTIVSDSEFVAHALLGVAAGVAGPTFMWLLDVGERGARASSLPRWARGAIGGLGVGLLAIPIPAVTGNGFEAIQRVLDAKVAAEILAIWLVSKAAATLSSVSSGSPGGVFTPTLFLGAALGGVFGHGVSVFSSSVLAAPTPPLAGSYALVGMAALTAATTHAPLMAATLVFELSGDYSIVLPLLLATSLSAFVSRRLRPDSIYTEELARRGVPWRGNLTERLARAVHASDILTLDVPCAAPDAPLSEVVARLAKSGARAIYVVTKEGVRRFDLHAALRAAVDGRASDPAVRVGDVAQPVPTVAPQASLLEVSERLWGEDWGEVPVVDPAVPDALVGVVTRRDALGAIDREILQRDVLLTRVVRFETSGEAADFLELPPGRKVEAIAVPPSLIGKTIDREALHEQYGIQVVGLRKEGRPGALEDPSASYVLGETDRLVVIGTLDGIEKLRRA